MITVATLAIVIEDDEMMKAPVPESPFRWIASSARKAQQ